jgi:hypothetical protein
MLRRIFIILSLAACLILFSGCQPKQPTRVQINEIFDVDTGQPVPVDVYVNSNLVASGVTEAKFGVPVPGEIKVEHPDYHPWIIEINAKTERTLGGPVEFQPLAAGGASG